LKRLDSIARSPIYALLGESVDGAAVIRAFGAQQTLFQRLKSILDKQQHAYFLTCAAQSWLAVRLELVGNLIVTFACASAVLQHAMDGANTRFAGLAGLAISYSLSVTQSLNWSVRMASDLEAAMVSVERIKEYSNLEKEGERTTNVDKEVEGKWPTSGTIEFSGAKLRYRPELPLVLNGLDLKIPGGSKVGVVGRTGAGKSTLMVSLMRIVELYEGKIFIDGIDTRTLGLSKLRTSIAVIPQDPLLFSGTVRSNLDPFNDHTNESLLDVLERVGLYKATGGETTTSSDNLVGMGKNTRIDSLDNVVSEGGCNFSVGQRQLLVIARALLRGTKIVIMDEATASIDAETDAMIQKVIRTAFTTATCLTVAHRLNTIMDSDYILVMDDGKVGEFDTPKQLLARGGMFKELVEAAAH
jgi:ABC-type multidrug transport system fused ATPase/permease subunit